MNAKITNIESTDKNELKQFMFDYFMEIDKSKIISESSNKIDYPYLDLYWTEKNRKSFFIELSNINIGFILINNFILNKKFNAQYSIAEFYIKPKYRRQGIGYMIVQELFSKFKGTWEVKQSTNNLTAINFWRNCIDKITNGNYLESKVVSDDELEIVQNFEIN